MSWETMKETPRAGSSFSARMSARVTTGVIWAPEILRVMKIAARSAIPFVSATINTLPVAAAIIATARTRMKLPRNSAMHFLISSAMPNHLNYHLRNNNFKLHLCYLMAWAWQLMKLI